MEEEKGEEEPSIELQTDTPKGRVEEEKGEEEPSIELQTDNSKGKSGGGERGGGRHDTQRGFGDQLLTHPYLKSRSYQPLEQSSA